MPHKGSPRTSMVNAAAAEMSLPPSGSAERTGADLLLSLAETASASHHHAPLHHHHHPHQQQQQHHLHPPPPPPAAAGPLEEQIKTTTSTNSDTNAAITETSPLSQQAAATAPPPPEQYSYQPHHQVHPPPVTPSPLVHAGSSGPVAGAAAPNKNMQMSLHGGGTHRLVPSPIKLPKSEQERQQQQQQEKRRADEPPDAAPCKKPRNGQESPTKALQSPQKTIQPQTASPTHHEPFADGGSVISPASSDASHPKSPEHDPRHHRPPQQAHPPPPAHYRPPYPPHPHHHPYSAAVNPQPWLHPAPVPPAGYYPVPPTSGYPQYYALPAAHHPYGAPPPPPPPRATQSGTPSPPPKKMDRKADGVVKKSIEDWQKTRATIGNKARCVPVEQPTKARKMVANPEDIDIKLPDFPLLVNFPEHLTRGQTRGTGEHKGLAPEGKRHCVMCGQLRICSSSANRLNRSTAPAETSNADSTVHIIPRQNKGVCTACDVTVWTVQDLETPHGAADHLEIKWCKGCKNFRPWPAFGDKGMATKCARCRHRQREKYALQKKAQQSGSPSSQYDLAAGSKEEDILAAQGLSNLMRAQNA